MKRIAVTYDYQTGCVFQHFGRTEFFKLYDVEDGTVVSSGVYTSNGAGHSALAGVLLNSGVQVLICGGIGMGAQNALLSCGIELVAGASGDADIALEEYLKGNLINTGSNCDHHDHHDGGCGHHEGGCGSHDGRHCCH